MPVLSRAEGPEAGPLDVLARQLQHHAPPSLGAVLRAIVPQEGFTEFMELVREYLPEHLAEVLSVDSVSGQIALFANRFRDRYFPLPYFEDAMWNDFSYEDLLQGIPIMFIGINWDDWHELAHELGLGRRIMAAMVESPWYSDDGAHTVLVESCLRSGIPRELLERIDDGGYPPADLHRWLDDSIYVGLAHLADVIWSETGVTFIDVDEESMPMYGWDPDYVRRFTQEWLRGQEIQREVGELEEYIDEDPPARFAELLDYIDQRKEERPVPPPDPPPEPNRPLYRVFEEGANDE